MANLPRGGGRRGGGEGEAGAPKERRQEVMSRGKVEEEVSEEIELPGWEKKIDRKGVAAKGEE